MENQIKAGAILIRDDAAKPKGIAIKSEPCSAGWRLVTHTDKDTLERAIQVGWSFCCRAEEISASLLGVDSEKSVRLVVERLLTMPRSKHFNSLEITRVSVTESDRFPQVHYVTVTGRPREIQKNILPFTSANSPDSRAGKSEIRKTREVLREDVSSAASRGSISVVRRANRSIDVARKIMVCLGLGLFSIPAIFAQDLSRYRDFSLQANVATISKQTGVSPSAVKSIYEKPAVIQELAWWPVEGDEAGTKQGSVQLISFSFREDVLYKIVATYDNAAIEGLTADDIVNAISAKYGVATRPAADNTAAGGSSLTSADVPVAMWEDSQYSATLFRSPLSQTYQLVVLSKALASEADADIAESVKQQKANAPEMEDARAKKIAEDMEAERQKNVKAFQP